MSLDLSDQLTESEAEQLRDHALPMVVPAGWRISETNVDGRCFDNFSKQLRVIASVERCGGRLWLHVSVSRRNGDTRYEDLKLAKDLFVRARYAYQVFPPPTKHVNINPNVLHVYAPLEGAPPLPDFTHGGDSI